MGICVYPAVVYAGKDGLFYISLPDLNLLAVGDSVEEVYVKGKDALNSYFDLAKRFDTEIPQASTYEQVKAKNPHNDVVMLDVFVKQETPTKEDQKFKNFLKLFFDEGE